MTKVTPVSTPREGKNFFRVEAKLDRADPRMRPNMEGVGKVEINRRSYLWIWTRQAVNSLRLILWSWLPSRMKPTPQAALSWLRGVRGGLPPRVVER